MNGDSDVVIFGHTHIFESDFKNNTLFLNPGEICAREKPLSEFVLLDINEKRYLVNYFYRSIDSKIYKKEEYIYERK
jgi:predicted phosphodiesterase